jgi:hypothetical protein
MTSAVRFLIGMLQVIAKPTYFILFCFIPPLILNALGASGERVSIVNKYHIFSIPREHPSVDTKISLRCCPHLRSGNGNILVF